MKTKLILGKLVDNKVSTLLNTPTYRILITLASNTIRTSTYDIVSNTLYNSVVNTSIAIKTSITK